MILYIWISIFSFGRMLSVYLCEYNRLAVVCKTWGAANFFEKYDPDGNVDVHFGIHQEEANLGVSVSRRFPIIWLYSVRYYMCFYNLVRKFETKEVLIMQQIPQPKFNFYIRQFWFCVWHYWKLWIIIDVRLLKRERATLSVNIHQNHPERPD